MVRTQCTIAMVSTSHSVRTQHTGRCGVELLQVVKELGRAGMV
jgi:hypothetical protein